MSGSGPEALMQKLAARLVAAGVACRETVSGCTEDEIQQVEATLERPLPLVYQAFLRTMGRNAGDFLRGTDMFYPKVLQLGAWAKELLREDGAHYSLPSRAFVFSMHQGYQFQFFELGEPSDDPPVYHYMEGDGAASQVAPTLSQYFLDGVEEFAQFAARSRQSTAR